MPAKSEAQRRYLYAKFGPAWVKEHHFDNPGKLPARAEDKKKLLSRRLAGQESPAAERRPHSESAAHERRTG